MSKNVTLGKHKVDVIGRFKLEVVKPKKKFRMTNITSFVPRGKTIEDKVVFLSPNGTEVDALIFDRIVHKYDPDRSQVDAHNVRSLIQHPKVKLGGISEKDWRDMVDSGYKVPKPEFILTNVDKQNINSYTQEAQLIEARAILLSTSNPISVEKLKWLCTQFRLGYRDMITDDERYRISLVKKLDTFIQDTKTQVRGKTNLERFIEANENMKRTEMVYYISKLQESQIITEIGGVFKVGDRPVGHSIDDIIDWYSKNMEIFSEHKKMVIERLRSQIA